MCWTINNPAHWTINNPAHWTINNPAHCTNHTLSYDNQKTMKKVEELVRNIPISVPVF